MISGYYSDVTGPGTNDITISPRGTVLQIPIPPNAVPAAGHDAQLVVWNRDTGDEMGVLPIRGQRRWHVRRRQRLPLQHELVGGRAGRFSSHRPGIPYLAGLIRAEEVRAGRIDHAIAFAFDGSAPTFIAPPATKSDGVGQPDGLAEGARLRLNPALTDADFEAWGLSYVGKLIAPRAADLRHDRGGRVGSSEAVRGRQRHRALGEHPGCRHRLADPGRPVRGARLAARCEPQSRLQLAIEGRRAVARR